MVAALGEKTLLPRLSDVLAVLLSPTADLLGKGSLFFHSMISTLRVLTGFLVGALLAIPLGLAMGLSASTRAYFGPFIEFLRPLCPVAWIPFAIVLFKTNSMSNVLGYHYTNTPLDYIQTAQIFILAWAAFFPVVVATTDGVSNTRNLWIEAAKTMGATKSQIVFKIVLPSALPSIITGLRTGLGTSWMAVIAAEMFPGPTTGIGYIMIEAYSLTETQILAAGLVAIGILGVALNWIVLLAQRRWANWPSEER